MNDSDYSDWYEDIVGIAVLAGSGKVRDHEAEIALRLYNLIDFLRDTKAKDEEGNLILEKARDDYSSKIKSRARHFYAQSLELRLHIESLQQSDPSNGSLPEKVRDFHNRVYYCVFFCARHFLVTNGRLDTNIHEKIPEHLNRLARDNSFQSSVSANNSMIQTTVAAITSAISQLQEHRNRADYIMNQRVMTKLSDKAIMDDSVRIIKNLAKDCGVQ